MSRSEGATGSAKALNAMSVDVEDWFQVQAFSPVIRRSDWDGLTPRVEVNTNRVLDHFDRAGVRATFFVLGWVAQRRPALIRRIVDAGHELASHGWDHALVNDLGEKAFRSDVRRTKRQLEDVSGVEVRGYRAPTFSIGPRTTPWAHAVLADEGHQYSSSVFPVQHDLYGAPDAPRGPHRPRSDGVLELPMTTVRVFGRNFPCSGGGWFRLVPYPVFRAGLRRVNKVDAHPGVFYFHPWEVDVFQPRVAEASRLSRFRHYTGLSTMAKRLDVLLADFSWGRMDEVFAAALASGPAPSPAAAG